MPFQYTWLESLVRDINNYAIGSFHGASMFLTHYLGHLCTLLQNVTYGLDAEHQGNVIPTLTVASRAIHSVLRSRSKGVTIITTEDKSQMSLFSPEDEKEAQKELKHLRKNENRVFKVNHKRTGFEDKTLWDKLNLFGTLAIPVILALATIGFGWWQVHLADLQHQSDQQRALDQQRQTTLVTYQDEMKDLLLNRGLLTSKRGDEIRVIALIETLSAIRQLDGKRNSFLVQFLQDAGLIGKDLITLEDHNIIDFFFADLSDIDLSGANLSGVNLIYANLKDANLTNAIFYKADLIYTNLKDANLTNALLYNANLKDANLTGANLTQGQLDQVATCKGAILPQGLTCHQNL